MIEVEGLTKVFGSTTAVDSLSFTVRPGVVTGFLGPNGAGKTTTMRMILGLDRPTAGQARIAGKVYADLTQPLATVGSLLEASWTHPNRSARSHLKWLAAAGGIPPARVGEVLDLVGLTEVAGKNAGSFSLGMKQRLGLAAALLADPDVLLLDEPVNGLDPEGIAWIRSLLRRLAGEGRTILVSSHLLSEMARTADHLIVIGRGALIADSPTDEFIAASTQSSVAVRSPEVLRLRRLLEQEEDVTIDTEGDAIIVAGLAAERIGEIAGSHGIILHALCPRHTSLEDAFMRLTGQSVEFASHDDPAGGDRS